MFELFNPLDFNDPALYAIPGFVLLIVIELYFYILKKVKPDKAYFKDGFASIGLGLGSVFLDIPVKAISIGYLLFFYNHFRIFDTLGPANTVDFIDFYFHWNVWWIWALCLILQDFAFYWHHRLSHEIRILWAAHVNHHSSMNYNLATALRQSWLELLYKDMWYIPLAILGFHPLLILTLHQINLIYQFWPHTEMIKKLPNWYEYIFNTPSHHRVHHSSNIKYLDKNYGGILIIWDRIFGSFEAEDPNEKCIYGITSNIHTYNLLKITFHELQNIIKDVKRAPTFKDKLNYLIQSPGWSHDGTDQRAKTLQQKNK